MAAPDVAPILKDIKIPHPQLQVSKENAATVPHSFAQENAKLAENLVITASLIIKSLDRPSASRLSVPTPIPPPQAFKSFSQAPPSPLSTPPPSSAGSPPPSPASAPAPVPACDSYSFAPALAPVSRVIQELLRRSRTSCSTFQLSLMYLIRLRNALLAQGGSLSGPGSALPPKSFPSVFPMVAEAPGSPLRCGRRMFLAALILANKYNCDKNYTMAAWAKICGLSVPELAENERAFLAVIGYDLYVPRINSQTQVDELNARIRRMASAMRLRDPDYDIKLQLEEDDELKPMAHRRIFDSAFALTEVPETPPLKPSSPDHYIPPISDNRSIEMTAFPGVLEKPSPLPHSVQPRKMLIRAMQGCRANRRIRQQLMLPHSESILCDFFWYMFLIKTGQQSAGAIAERDALFARIAGNYVQLLLQTSSRDRADLSFVFTGVVGSAVHASFGECFPDSIAEFDSEFQVAVSDLLSEWLIGMRPSYANGWKNTAAMAGLRRPANASSRSELSTNAQEQNFLELMGEGDGNQDPNRLLQSSIPSAYIGSVPQTRRVLFDANGNSRVIERYLGKAERRIINIHRTESPRESPDHGTQQTYRQVVAESARRSRNLQRAYKLSQETAQREKSRLLQNLNEQLSSERKRITKILARPEQVRDTADQIIDMVVEQRERKEPARAAL
ncbi:hypothetical protein HKX48_002426 [Thoreauomyces humboldtii]|nr:hypothetical protein HKX48_002426 [Thoreauomyces humboldtii]